jgi:hypothetical protein
MKRNKEEGEGVQMDDERRDIGRKGGGEHRGWQRPPKG